MKGSKSFKIITPEEYLSNMHQAIKRRENEKNIKSQRAKESVIQEIAIGLENCSNCGASEYWQISDNSKELQIPDANDIVKLFKSKGYYAAYFYYKHSKRYSFRVLPKGNMTWRDRIFYTLFTYIF